MERLKTLPKSFEAEDLLAEVECELISIVTFSLSGELQKYAKHMAGGIIKHGETAVRIKT